MHYPPSLDRLIEALRCLPGVGPKSAQRMAFHLLERDRDGARQIATAVGGALERLGRCSRCRMFAEGELCPVCAAPGRDRGLLCVVESPADVVAIEQSGGFRGCYFVLMGHLSPLDGIGPEEIGIDALERLLGEDVVREVILATNPTMTGEATAMYIAEQLPARVRVTRLASGLPVGGDLEYADELTLGRALAGRRDVRHGEE